MQSIPLSHVRITSGFWKTKQDLVAQRVLPYQWKALNDEVPGAEPSHSLENFRIAAGKKKGEFYGLIFQDSDIGKWIEAVAYSLAQRPDPALEAHVDEAVELIAAAQEPDGYLQTYFTVKAPGKRWTDFALGHEMYCGGHLIEGAVAYFQVTGKRAFLDVMCRYADLLVKTFGPGPGQLQAFDGHPEIELALHRLADATGVEDYRRLARFFVDVRGPNPVVLDHSKILGWPIDPKADNKPDYTYYQAHLPVRDQREAVGHSVRAMYLYSAMADQRRLGDASLEPALDALWSNTVDHKMYVTGGLGSQAHGERFTVDDDLPPDSAYTETCAAIGLVLWAWRMSLVRPEAKYADILEKALYNGALAGMSLDGTRYFYVNPLEVAPRVARFRHDLSHVKTQRVEWFGCACCPPNIARTVASVAQYQYSVGQGIWAHQFAQGTARIPFGGTEVVVEQLTDYPWDGRVTFRFDAVPNGDPWSFLVRIPGWCPEARISVNGQNVTPSLRDGYVELNRPWRRGDTVVVDLTMEPRVVESAPAVAATYGRVAVERGPLVYCAEEIDNGEALHQLALGGSPRAEVVPLAALGEGVKGLRFAATRAGEPTPLVLVPYHLWGNRGEGEMRVWLGQDYPRGTSK